MTALFSATMLNNLNTLTSIELVIGIGGLILVLIYGIARFTMLSEVSEIKELLRQQNAEIEAILDLLRQNGPTGAPKPKGTPKAEGATKPEGFVFRPRD